MCVKYFIRAALEDDFSALVQKDKHVNEAWVKSCIRDSYYVVAEMDDKLIAFMRYSYFWGEIPYMDMIMVDESARRKGVGTAMLNFWTEEMKRKGKKALMTSAMSDEPEPLVWHRRNGFVECGQLTFGVYQEIPEIFLIKNL